MGGRKHPEQPLLYVDTTDILFILSGAFVGLGDIISRRTGKGAHRIGFTGASEPRECETNLSEVTPEDLRTFGLIPEFIGRFPIITHVEPLDRNALVRILTEPENALLKQYTELLRQDGVRLEFTSDAVGVIADAAIASGTGARGLRLVMEKIMRDIMFDAPKAAAGRRSSKIVLNGEKVSGLLVKEFRKAE